MFRALNLTSSIVTSSLRQWRGTAARAGEKRPEKMLELYEFEGCPFCRKVRETLTELDLDALIYPCPKGGERFRPQAVQMSGKEMFPFLVDPNTGTQLLESDAIVAYLHEQYGNGRKPKALPGMGLGTLASTIRLNGKAKIAGMFKRASKQPAQPLELFSFESSPYSRPVRELLCELEIPYQLRNTGKVMSADMGPSWVRTRFYKNAPVKGPKRIELLERGGKLQVPYLADPNTGQAMYESADINKYLLAHYAG